MVFVYVCRVYVWCMHYGVCMCGVCVVDVWRVFVVYVYACVFACGLCLRVVCVWEGVRDADCSVHDLYIVRNNYINSMRYNMTFYKRHATTYTSPKNYCKNA